MTTRYHGRITPGVVTDPRTVLQVVLNAPAKGDGIKIKIWELDTFTEEGKTKQEGSGDDLLAEFDGKIVAGKQGTPAWRTFQVTSHKIVSEDPDLVRFRLSFPGSPTVYEIPIVSEKDEAEGRSFEIGFSLEQGGAEKFRSKAPCFFRPRTLVPTFIERQVWSTRGGELPAKVLREHKLVDRYVCIGTKDGEKLDARLKILAFGRIDAAGNLLVGADQQKPAPLPLRADRKLYFFAHQDPLPAERQQPGRSKIPIALCAPLGDDGKVIWIQPDVANRHDARIVSTLARSGAEKWVPLSQLPETKLRPFTSPGGKVGKLLQRVKTKRRP